MARDNADVPPIMVKCCTAIEKYGIQLQGIYRLSGTTSKVQKLREQLDRGQSLSSFYELMNNNLTELPYAA